MFLQTVLVAMCCDNYCNYRFTCSREDNGGGATTYSKPAATYGASVNPWTNLPYTQRYYELYRFVPLSEYLFLVMISYW